MRNRGYRFGAALATSVLIAAGAVALRAQATCTYGLGRLTATVPSTGGTVSVPLTTQADCGWSASVDAPASLPVSTGAGPADGLVDISVTVPANDTQLSTRTLNVTVTDPATNASLLFVITQAGTACTFAIATPPSVGPAAGGPGSITVATQPNCAWTATPDSPFVTLSPSSGVADASGVAIISYTLDPNATPDTRRSWIEITNGGVTPTNYAYTPIAQAGATQPSLTSWDVGDVFAGIGSYAGDWGRYRVVTPTGAVKTDSDNVAVPDLNDAFNYITTGCMVDPNPTVGRGDLFTTGWDGLLISRFSDATHQLVSAIDLTPGGLASVQRKPGTVPVPYTENLNIGFPWPDITYTEQLVFDQSGNFYVGTSMYVTGDVGLGHAYLLKFAKNDDASVCSVAGPCLLDWWRVDAAGEAPTGQVPAGTNAEWTALYKAAYAATAGDAAAKTAAAFAAVRPLAASLNYVAGSAPQQPGPAGVEELDLSSDQHTIFYTSEDNRIRRFDTSTGQQLAPITITDLETHEPYHGKAYGFRLLPDGNGNADGSAGMIVAMSIGILRLGADGASLKPAGSPHVIGYDVEPGIAHPFAMNLTPDAQSFWVATSQYDAGAPSEDGAKIYRFHIPTGKRYGPFDIGATDIQGLCVKREYTAGVNQCFATDNDGKGLLDSNGDPIPIVCKQPTVCQRLGIDADGHPNASCYPPGEVPLVLADRSSFEGDRPSDDATADLDLLPLTPGHRIVSLNNLPQGLTPIADSVTGDIIAIGGTLSYNICPKENETRSLPSDPVNVCAQYTVGVNAMDGASTSFVWKVHYRNAPPSISSSDVTIRALSELSAPTPASDSDPDDALIVRVSGKVLDTATNTFIPVSSLADFGIGISSGRFFPSAGVNLAVVGHPRGYPLAAPDYPTTFEITLDLYDCNNATLSPTTNPDTDCFHNDVSTTFKLTVVNVLPQFVSGFDVNGDPVVISAGVDQFSQKGVSLASVNAEYVLRAADADAHLPVTFTFTCANADGSPNTTACDPATGLPRGLTAVYAGALGNAPDPANTVGTNQFVTIGGTPTVPANNLLITVTLSDLAGGRNVAPFTFHWTIHGGPALNLTDQISPAGTAVSYDATGTSPNGYALTYSVTGLPSWLTFNTTSHVISGTTPATAPLTPPVITVTITDQPPAGKPAQTATTTFTWFVHEKPRLTVLNQQSAVNTGVIYRLDPLATSPNGFPVSITTSALPSWLSFDPGTQTFTGVTPTTGGSFPIDVTVTDQVPADLAAVPNPAGSLADLTTTARFTWYVREPLSLTVSDQFTMGGANGSYAITPKVVSANGFPLTFTITNKPSWLTFDSASQTFSGVAPMAASATAIGVTVTDVPPAGITPSTVSATFTWTVRLPPAVIVHDQANLIDTPVSYTLTPLAASPNGYPITITATTLPSWLAFNAATQTFTGTTPGSGGEFDVVLSVTDTPPAGQPALTTIASFKWRVFANRAPVCEGAAPSNALWPPNHKFVNVTVNGVTDPDAGDRVTITINSIWQDEPVATKGSGHTGVADGAILGGGSIAAVRAERTGVKGTPGDGRVYQINFTASDGKDGGTCTGSVRVGVPHDQGKMKMPVFSGIWFDSLTGARID